MPVAGAGRCRPYALLAHFWMPVGHSLHRPRVLCSMIAATRDSPFCERKRAVLSTSQRFTDHVSSHVHLFYFGRFILVYVYRISEVLSSWRLGTKVKHAVNNVDSALNFVTGNIFNQKK